MDNWEDEREKSNRMARYEQMREEQYERDEQRSIEMRQINALESIAESLKKIAESLDDIVEGSNLDTNVKIWGATE